MLFSNKGHHVINHSTDDIYLSTFLEITQHDNAFALELPNHPPEVSNSVLEWSLGSYVGIALLVAL